MNSEKLKVKKKARNEGRPGYKKTKVGWIPEDWECVQLRKLGDEKRPAIKAGPFGSSLKKEYYVKNGYKIYGQEQVIAGAPFYGDYFIDEEHFESLRSCEVFPGDILLSLVGTIGKVLLIPPDYQKGIINPRLLRISLSKKCISSLYTKYYLEAEHTLRLLNSWAQGGTMGVLNAQIVGSLPIPLPPPREQKKIAEILSAWDRAIEQVGKLIDAKERLKKGLMQQLLTGRMRFSGFGKPVQKKGKLPKGWCVIMLGNIASVSTGDRDNKDKVEGGKYPFFVRSQTIERIDSYSYDGEAILIPGEGKIGEVVHYINGKFDFHQRVYKISDFHSIVYGLFLFYNFKYYFPQQARRFSVRMTADSLRRSAFTSMKLLIPSYTEQTRIAAVLSTCDREIELLKKKLEKLKEQKKGLMQKLLTGEIRHPEFLKEGNL